MSPLLALTSLKIVRLPSYRNLELGFLKYFRRCLTDASGKLDSVKNAIIWQYVALFLSNFLD